MSATSFAATTTVTSITALQNAINGANPGDVIILQNGSYSTSTNITISRQGTASAPILIRAESIGGATISGSGSIRFASPAAYCTIQGFVLTHAGSINIPCGTRFCRVTRCRIDLAIPSGTDSSYMNIQGDDAQIDYNELHSKTTLGNMLDITGCGSQVARRLWVHHNLFRDFSPAGGNGAETIRWGLSGLSLSTGNGLCEYNLFLRCDGENEMISNKSSGNVYRYNTVIDGREMSQRHGDNCQYYGNYMKNSEGIRIYGDNHLFHSNYLEGNTTGIVIGNGDGDVHAGDPLTSHDRPDNNVIVHNTLFNNTSQYSMGGRTGGLGSVNTTFSNNIIVGGNSAANISTSGPYSGSWQGNIIWNTSAGSMPSSGYTSVDPQLVRDADGVMRLTSGSPAINTAVGTFSGVTVDMDGQPRTSPKDKGADEFSSAPETAWILTTADVGPNADLTQTPTASAPVLSPGGGTFTSAVSVSMSSATAGATIRYTTDGSTPTATTGTVYTGPITISNTTTVRAIATASGHNPSSVTSATYTISNGFTTITSANGFVNRSFATQTGTFTFTIQASASLSPSNAIVGVSSGAATGYTSVAAFVRFNQSGFIDARNGGAFTTGTIPFSAGTTYSFRLVVNVAAKTYSAFVTAPGGSEQTIGTNLAFRTEQAGVTSLNNAVFNVNTTPGGSLSYGPQTVSTTQAAAAPTFSPAGGTFTSPVSVSMSSTTAGATIRYTTDGSTPTGTTGTVYTGPITISTTTTVRAIATASGFTNSTVSSATYTINTAPTTTTITSANGFVNRAFASQTGTFTFRIDASASISPSNAIIALSSGAQTAYTGMAAAVRFNQSGFIDARNGGAYTTGTIPFSAGTTYQFRIVVNVPAKTYSAFVTAPGGSEQTIGTNLAFRTEQAGVTSLNNAVFNVNATPGGSMTYGATTISP